MKSNVRKATELILIILGGVGIITCIVMMALSYPIGVFFVELIEADLNANGQTLADPDGTLALFITIWIVMYALYIPLEIAIIVLGILAMRSTKFTDKTVGIIAIVYGVILGGIISLIAGIMLLIQKPQEAVAQPAPAISNVAPDSDYQELK